MTILDEKSTRQHNGTDLAVGGGEAAAVPMDLFVMPGARPAHNHGGHGDQRTGRGLVSGLHELLCGAAALVGGAHQRRQHGQSFAGALVHASLAVFAFLAQLDLGVGDRAWRDP